MKGIVKDRMAGLIILPFLFAFVSCHLNSHLTVKVEGGLIQGVSNGEIAVFKGIPFAAPPVGELRWKAPQPVRPWNGVLETKDFAPSPVQADEGLYTSEDCLYLNVWTPAKSSSDSHRVMHLTNRGSHAGDVPDESSLMVLDGYFTWRRTR